MIYGLVIFNLIISIILLIDLYNEKANAKNRHEQLIGALDQIFNKAKK